MNAAPAAHEAAQSNWKQAVARYQRSSLLHSLLQITNTLVPYIALWVLMYFSLRVSYLLTLLLSVIAAGFLVRIFIFFHDCGHGSFFASRKANEIVGFWLGLLVFTPGQAWWHSHAIHHATAGNLDRRGTGDILTMTVKEYMESPWWKRISYYVFRHPLVMFTIGAPIVFIFANRTWKPGSNTKTKRSVMLTNLALAGMVTGLSLLMGFKEYLLIQLPVIIIASIVGVWLFYVQHQFENTYWAHNAEWDFATAALRGASYYRLPRVLQWFTGSIGLHHLHHLSPRIPNYYLQKCLDENPAFKQVTTLTLWSSLRSLRLRLWDEEQKVMISFRELERKIALRGNKIHPM